ncbi:hypothetical protein QZH41_006471 [Actinostola sp. cb2023]|nr:hypothetical protein QZH41_006471 [Actinostola sp. cb2023]
MSFKLALFFLVGLLALVAAVPVEQDSGDVDQTVQASDEPEQAEAQEDVAEADEPQNDLAETEQEDEAGVDDPSRRPHHPKKAIYCYYYAKKRRCRHVCVRNHYGRKYYKKCFRLCCDYLKRIRYICGWCYFRCNHYRYGYRHGCYYRCKYLYRKY